MNSTLALSIALPALSLVAVGLIPSSQANKRVVGLRRLVTSLAGFQFAFAVLMAFALAAGLLGDKEAYRVGFASDSFSPLFLYYDGVASLMWMMVSFIGWVICNYSIRYLNDERDQGRYFRWISLTIGAVSLMVLSGNLLVFVATWLMTSLGLHQLLLHYGHRPAAQRAAWTKFTVSRIGDVALIAAMVLIYAEWKTLDFDQLFAAIQSHSGEASVGITLASLFLVLGAVTKSAQVPFHTWLPQTMETPTPVSALMHAGIVNAGGYLIIRTSPIVSATPWVLSALAVCGIVTACFAAVVMLTQTSVKKSLAYSTIAQMGFMMLQCGLGAFSAAMLHILAHSLYKAHAFLGSGSVLSQRSAVIGTQPVKLAHLAIAAVLVVPCFALVLALMGINAAMKPGGILLGGIICLALAYWVAQVLGTGSRRLLVRSLLVTVALSFLYVASYAAVDSIVASSLPLTQVSGPAWPVTWTVIAGFAGILVLHSQLLSAPRPRWIHSWYIHVINGFYIESCLQRVFGPLASK